MSAVADLVVYRNGGRQKLLEEGRCRMCLEPRRHAGVRALTRHHLVPKRWPGWARLPFTYRDADANCVPLCTACHRAVETDEMARRMLRKVLGPAEASFAVRLRGQAWFDGRYPPARQAAGAL